MAEKGLDKRMGLLPIGAAEEVGVVEEVVELVEVDPGGGSRWKGPCGGVSLEKGGRKAAEKPGHGEVGLPVGEVNSRIKEDRLSGGKADITAPQVAVNEGRGGRVVVEKVGDPLKELLGLEDGESLPFGEAHLWGEAALSEKGGPIRRRAVELWAGADPVVSMPAEGGGGMAVQVSQLPSHEGPVRGGRVKVDRLEDKEGVVANDAVQNGHGDADGAGGGDGFEGIRFTGEGLGMGWPVELDEETSPVCTE